MADYADTRRPDLVALARAAGQYLRRDDHDPDASHIQCTIVTIVVALGHLGFGALWLAAADQDKGPSEIGCVYDPQDGSKTCVDY